MSSKANDRYHARRRRLELYVLQNRKCSKCNGDLSQDPFSIEVHHKDENTSNNNLDNLELVCRRCHRIWHSSKVHRYSKIKELTGYGYNELRSMNLPTSRYYSLRKWETIKHLPNAIQICETLGRVGKPYRKYHIDGLPRHCMNKQNGPGKYTLQQIGNHLGGLSRQRVAQLINDKNPRITKAIEEMLELESIK